ncbi:calpain-3 [Rhodovulum sulfidophilum]|uniref:Calpain-3 n=1 Tax=Rhodovulum sulfidophilum TaxID=35806 RepID=A0A0D6AZX7_RHOSU|nr:calpain-3 [Rhodovulum sulfidophilum]
MRAKQAPGAIMTYVRSFDPEASNTLQRMLSDRIGTVETAAEPTGREAQRTARLFNRFEGTL